VQPDSIVGVATVGHPRLDSAEYLALQAAWRSAIELISGEAVVPDLVVEVLSPATRINDLGVKKDAYLAAGERELWLVDPQAAAITTMQPNGRRQMLAAGEQLASRCWPDSPSRSHASLSPSPTRASPSHIRPRDISIDRQLQNARITLG
jgi:hypothetical protein